MKQIILDFYRRWGLGIAALVAAHFFLEQYAAQHPPEAAAMTRIFSCQILMFMGFMLSGDLFRGQGRILAILPVTAQQSGRALWIASVLLPGVALSISSVFCLLNYAHRSVAQIFAPTLLIHWAGLPLVLGACFGALSWFPTSAGGQSMLHRIRGAAVSLNFILPLAGWFYLGKENISAIPSALVVGALAFTTVRGWILAGHLISVTAGFRLSAMTPSKKLDAPLAPSGVGGLRFLVEQTLFRSVLMGLGMMALLVIVLAILGRGNQTISFSQRFIGAATAGFTPYIFMLVMGSIPFAQQLRFLRTLPISPMALTFILVILPIVSLSIVGLVLVLLIGPVGGWEALFPLINSFASMAGITALVMAAVVWRGLDFVSYIILMILLVSGSLIPVVLNIFFSVRAIPPWISLATPAVMIAAGFALTHRLVSRSSVAYRVRPANPFNWGQVDSCR